jgi:uncharacterized protein (TIGR00369 family)
MTFEPLDPNFEQKVRDSFSRQKLMDTIGARINKIAPGYCEIHLNYIADLTQQHGFFHGGIIGTIADTSAGYAAYSLMPAGDSVLTVEYKLNLVAPGDGNRLIARGHVVKPGRTLTIAKADVWVLKDGIEKLCATTLVTLMRMAGKADHPTIDGKY